MTLTCCVPTCREKYKKGSANMVFFYSFPSDAEMAKKWVVALRQQNFIITNDTKICSKHFTTDSFNSSPRSKKSLKKDAIPTVFEFPVRLFSSIPRKIPALRKTVDIEDDTDSLLSRYLVTPTILDTESSSDDLEIPSRQKKRYIGDFKDEDLSRKNSKSEEEFRRMVKKVLRRKNTQIKSLQQTKRRLTRKVEELTSLVKQLKEK